MELSKPFHRKKIVVIFLACILIFSGLSARVVYLMVFRAAHYSELALDLHQRERKIKAKRGRILDRNGIVLADNQPVCTISVIHNQIRDPNAVIAFLCSKLGLSEETVRKRVEKVSSIEKIKSNVDLETGEEIYRTGLDGIKVDEDYKRYYPYENLASKVIGFTGGDNQGILALESRYEEVLSGQEGLILEMTDARGVRILDEGESRVEPVDGKDLYISLDANIQLYAQQLAEQVCLEKEAESVSILVLRPDNGEILAMADVPEYQLNDPFTLPEGQREQLMNEKEKQEALNKMWRNACINDTYEPGSAFKVITAAAALENGVVREEDSFQCPGYIVVEGRKIRCAKVRGHGTENFVQGTMNSCNPVFVTVGLRMGADTFYQSMKQFGLLNRTGIDVPGEAGTIMHAQDQIGPVELATISFGQSFQITPIQLAATVSSLINGGTRITFGTVLRKDGRFGAHFGTEGNGAKTDSFGRNERPAAQHPVSGRGKRRREKWKSRRLSGGRQDGDQRDASSRYWSVYFFVSGFCTCGRSEGAGIVHYPKPPRRLLWRTGGGAGSARAF